MRVLLEVAHIYSKITAEPYTACYIAIPVGSGKIFETLCIFYAKVAIEDFLFSLFTNLCSKIV